MTTNKLCLNTDKTELLVISSKYRRTPVPVITVSFNNKTIHPSSKARNLGVLFDCNLSYHDQISQTVKSGYFHLRSIKSVSKYLSQSSIESLIHSFVTSRLDTNNSILYNIPDYEIYRLQKLQNSAARLLSSISRRQHITPILFKLHWLPVIYRIHYKVLVLTFKCLNNVAPKYLIDQVSVKLPVRLTRQSQFIQIQPPKTKCATVGDRSFSAASAKLFNALPPDIRTCSSLTTFQSKIKTHLFTMAFSNLM